VDIVTKSGTNSIHGDAFEFFRNDVFNANGFFQNRLGVKRGKLEQNQYGFTLGGPAIKDKLFWFGSYQGTKQINGVAAVGSATVSLPPQLTNDRSAATLGAEFCTVPTFTPSGTPNPASDQVACNGSNINPVALTLLNRKLPASLGGGYVIPTPTSIATLGSGKQVGQAAFSIPARFTENQALFNLDYVINSKNTLSGRYFYAIAPQNQAFTNGGGQPPGSGIAVLSGDQFVLGKLASTLTSNLLNEARFSSYYIRASINSLDPLTASSVGTQTAASYYNLIPVFSFGLAGYTSIGGTIADQGRPPQLIYGWSDQISWAHGKHTVRAGYDERYVHMQGLITSFNRGTLSFQTFSDFLLGQSAAQNGTALSNIYESSATVVEPPNGTLNLNRENSLSLFAQDDYKVNRRLTFNLGLRWEYVGSAFDSNSPLNGGPNPIYALDETVPFPTAAGTLVGYTVAHDYAGAVPAGVLRRSSNLLTYGHQPLDNFSPRIGFAWQPLGTPGKFVVRGGFGIFYNTIQGNSWEIGINTNPPSTAPLTYIGAQNALATLSNPFNPSVSVGGFNSFYRTPTSNVTQNGADPNMRTPYVESYNLNVQYEVKPSWVVQLGYSGSHGVLIQTGRAFNEAVLATASTPVNCGGPSGCITTNTAQNASLRTPVLGLRPGGFSSAGNWGYSMYSALQASLQKTMKNGLQLQASYTYGRSFTDVVGVNIQGGIAGTVNSNDPNDLHQSKGPSDFNRPQRFIVNYVYNLPGFKGNEAVAQKLLTGWSVSGVTTVQSGQPITFIDSGAGAVYGGFELSTARAQLCPGAKYSQILSSGGIESRLNHYFNSAGVFCAPPIIGQVGGVGGATGYGDSKRGPVLGPGQFNSDFALAKDTKVGGLREDASLEFRAEVFNVFNHAQFSIPGSTLNNGVPNGSFGVITTTSVGPRIMQFALKYVF
jgi:hypothetical protein